jgi:hypothetical protein
MRFHLKQKHEVMKIREEVSSALETTCEYIFSDNLDIYRVAQRNGKI